MLRVLSVRFGGEVSDKTRYIDTLNPNPPPVLRRGEEALPPLIDKYRPNVDPVTLTPDIEVVDT
jgi:hypothetical protein